MCYICYMCLTAFLWEAFRRFDADGSGHLDEHECKNMQLGSAWQPFFCGILCDGFCRFLIPKKGAKGEGTTTWKRFHVLDGSWQLQWDAMGHGMEGIDRGHYPSNPGRVNGGAEVCIFGLGLGGSKSYRLSVLARLPCSDSGGH